MSGAGAGPEDEEAKKRKREEEALVVEQQQDLVVISNMGSVHNVEEMEADAVTAFFMCCKISVGSYVCVPYCGRSIFAARHVNSDNKGYVKRMFPSTKCLGHIAGKVMLLLCHGEKRNYTDRTPSFISFHEQDGVDIHGNKRLISPDDARIWACSAVEINGNVHTKPADGVTLSEVVGRSKLVLMLCCYAECVMEEYAVTAGNKVDLLIFKNRGKIFDTSVYVLLALLMRSMEKSKEHTGSFDAIVKRHIYQVLLWVQTYGTDANGFWDFLVAQHCLSNGPSHTHKDYRIQGSIFLWTLGAHCKQELLDDIRLVCLGLWSDGSGASPRGYTWVDSTTHTKQELQDLIRETPVSGTPLRRSERVKSKAGQTADLDSLLLQLRGLLRGA